MHVCYKKILMPEVMYTAPHSKIVGLIGFTWCAFVSRYIWLAWGKVLFFLCCDQLKEFILCLNWIIIVCCQCRYVHTNFHIIRSYPPVQDISSLCIFIIYMQLKNNAHRLTFICIGIVLSRINNIINKTAFICKC